jgi:hypothetical protein
VKKPETKFKEKVLKDLKSLGKNVWFVKIQQVAIRGTPDLIICAAGLFVAIELKVENGEVDLLQAKTLLDITNANGRSFVVTPGSWPEVLREIESIINQVSYYKHKPSKSLGNIQ